MTLNILFLTITITKRKTTVEQELHYQEVEKIFEENRDRVEKYIRPF